MDHYWFSCRLCNGDTQVRVKLKDTPIANAFQDKPGDVKKYPLELAECVSCGHVQLRHIIPDDVIFPKPERTKSREQAQYFYRTPPENLAYLKNQASAIRGMFPKARSVVEIGANNGLFLDALADEGFRVYGVDPCGTGTVFWKQPFDAEVAYQVCRREGGKVDVIVANNVLAHIVDLDAVFDGIGLLLSPEGSLIFEVQYFKDMADNGYFDMIYHEHRDYHRVETLRRFLKKHGLYIHQVDRIPNHGGSIRIYAGFKEYSSYPVDEEIDWQAFQSKIDRVCSKQIEKGTILFGAPAKATTLLHNMDCVDKIQFCVDDTYIKQDKFLPGTSIKIYPTTILSGTETVLLASWNYADIIKAKWPELTLINPHE